MSFYQTLILDLLYDPPLRHVTSCCIGFPGAAEKFCTLALASWRPQWSETFTCVHFLDIEMIFAIDIDMGIPGGPDMGKITVLHRVGFLPQLLYHSRHVDRIPDDDGIRHEVQTERLMG